MEKGEYYPTPLSVVEAIAPHISVVRFTGGNWFGSLIRAVARKRAALPRFFRFATGSSGRNLGVEINPIQARRPGGDCLMWSRAV